MAVFYKHIKGTTRPGTGADDGLGTGIRGADQRLKANTVDQYEDIAVSTKMECAPNILVGSNNDSKNLNDLGHIITSKATEQVIQNPIKINNFTIDNEKINSNGDCEITTNGATGYFSYPINFSYIPPVGEVPEDPEIVTIDPIVTTVDINWLTNIASLHTTDDIICNKSILIGPQNKPDIILNERIVNEEGQESGNGAVKAVYFNATSDKRAKENIVPLETNALDIIKNVQVYTFNFKSQPEERMVGVIAQEFLDKKLDDVSLVANEAATGENGDYMSIRESKLVYLLLKGMQEQQVEIEELKAQIKKLESR